MDITKLSFHPQTLFSVEWSDEEETNVFQEALHQSVDSNEDKYIVQSLKDSCLRFLGKNIHSYTDLSALPNELLESLFLLVQKYRGIDDLTFALFTNLNSIEVGIYAPSNYGGRNNRISDKGLCKFAFKAAHKLRHITLAKCFHISDFGIYTLLQRCINLQSLAIGACPKISMVTIKRLSSMLPNLTALSIAGNTQLSDTFIDYIIKLKHLRKLNLSYCNVTDYTARVLGTSKVSRQIENLYLRGCDAVSNTGLQYICSACSPSLKVLDISECTQLCDNNIMGIVLACQQLELLTIGDLNKLTVEIIKWLHEYNGAVNLNSIVLTGNSRITMSDIRQQMTHTKSLRTLFGGTVRITILRNDSFRRPFHVYIDQFNTLNQLLDRVYELVLQEDPEGYCTMYDNADYSSHWQRSDLRFRRVGYRKNGTKRPTNLYTEEQHGSLIKELLGHKRYFYLEQTKSPPVTDPSPNLMFLKIRRWNSEKHIPEFLDDLVIAKTTLIGDLKIQIWTRYLPDILPARMLFIEEETSMKFNYLLENESKLSSYDLISGDIIHVEEITPWHLNTDGTVKRKSHTADYYLQQDIFLHVTETKESFARRQKEDENCIPFVKLDLCVKVQASQDIDLLTNQQKQMTFLELKTQISSLTALSVESIQLYTRVTPGTALRGDERKLVDVLEGNTWLLAEIETFSAAVDNFSEHDHGFTD